ncbi:MAG TPA: hypothetical protein VN442_01590 [Bryobacteraceae bacterium]|nr:hypothetical protein [Bryobacteraceae bacterium]
MENKTARERTRLVEDRLKRFRSLKLDPAEIQASRKFHLAHWLTVAEDAVRREHREMYYNGLSANLEEALASYPDSRIPPALQKAVLRDLAFMEGHLQAFRETLDALARLRQDQR